MNRGEWAVITGAGSGIGRFLCRYFADRGMNIAALDIDRQSADDTAALCRSNGLKIRGYAVDVSDRDGLIDLASELQCDGIVPTVLWANAGVGSAANTVDAKPETVEWLYSVNVLGPIWTGQAFIPRMRRLTGARHVGITASSASVTPVSGPFTLYATSKQATAAVGEAWMAECIDDEIDVTILCPGILDTDIWNSARSRPDRFGGSRSAPLDAGAHWRAQPKPDVLRRALDETIANGGGWCIVPTEDTTISKIHERHDAQNLGVHKLETKDQSQ